MFTWNSAYSASSSSFLSSTFRLFFDTSSGVRLSIEICIWSRPARFSRSIRSAVNRYPFVIIPAIAPVRLMRRIISSSSGCVSGSPPEIPIMAVPSRPSASILRFISSRGTGFDTLSYSLQYAQLKLQKRMGIICTSTGCDVEASARATIAYSRTFRLAAISRPRTVSLRGIPTSNIESQSPAGCPGSQRCKLGAMEGCPILDAQFASRVGNRYSRQFPSPRRPLRLDLNHALASSCQAAQF